MQYYGLIFPLGNGRFAVEFPDIPEAFSEGETLEECLDNACEVMAIAVEEYLEKQKLLPRPSSAEEVWRLSRASDFYAYRKPDEAIMLFPQSIPDNADQIMPTANAS